MNILENAVTPFKIGYPYAILFLALGIIYFKIQFRKILREGVRATALW